MHERWLMIELNTLETSPRESSHQRERLPLFLLRLESAQILDPKTFNLRQKRRLLGKQLAPLDAVTTLLT